MIRPAGNGRPSAWQGREFRAWALECGRLRIPARGAGNDHPARPGFTLPLRACLLQGANLAVLVDCGPDPGLMDALPDVAWQPPDHPLEQQLAALEVDGAGVDHVILTHLDGDHAGGLWNRGAERFPAATVHVQRASLEWWQHELEGRPRVRYFRREDLARLRALPRLVEHEGDWHLAPGIEVWCREGHTPGHQVVRVEGPGGLLLAGDLLSTRSSFRPGMRNEADENPALATRLREELAGQACGAWFLCHGAQPWLEHNPAQV